MKKEIRKFTGGLFPQIIPSLRTTDFIGIDIDGVIVVGGGRRHLFSF